jgi:subtilisin family serine protease
MLRFRFFLIAGGICVVGTNELRAGPIPLQRLETPVFEGPVIEKAAPELSALAKGSLGEPLIVWIQFQDKGFRKRRGFARRAASERDRLSEATLRRRAKVLSADSLVRVGDLPLEEQYVATVLAEGVRLRARSRWFNAISVEADAAAIARIGLLPFVHRMTPVVREQRPLVPAIPETGPKKPSGDSVIAGLDYGLSATQIGQINVDHLHDLGLSGNGVIVGVLDAGFAPFSVESLHHAKILAEKDFVDHDRTTFDTPDHGTAVLSVLGGFAPGQLIGPAYGASFLLARTEIIEDGIEIQMEEDLWVAGLEWLEREGAEVVNSSLGYSDWYLPEDFDGQTAVTTVAADAAVERGVFIANSVGNDGVAGLTAPADGFNVCAVGAVTASGSPWVGSSRGPTADGRIKPDVAAMGVNARIADSRLRDQVLFDSDFDLRDGPVDFSVTYVVGADRASKTFRLALTLKDDTAGDVAWLGKPVGPFSGLAVHLVRGGATEELWVDDFSDAGVLSDPSPAGFGYEGDVLRFQNGGIETTLENRFDITLLLDLTPVLPDGGVVQDDRIIIRTTSQFDPLLGINVSYLDDVAGRAYSNGTGTSFASPLVAGVAALILEARPGWTPLQVLDALRCTASQASTPDNAVGFGIVDAHGALFDSGTAPSADIDGDGSVGGKDLHLFYQDWRTVHLSNETALGTTMRSDLDLDGEINDEDLFLITSQWGE